MYGKKRNKVVTVRVDEDLYNEFLKVVEGFTTKFSLEYSSKVSNTYYVRFPEKNFYHCGKYTLGDLVETSMQEFIRKYKKDV